MNNPGFTPGQLAWWSYTPRGGYGWTIHVPAVVIKVNRATIKIAALTESGDTTERNVHADKLRPMFGDGDKTTLKEKDRQPLFDAQARILASHQEVQA